MCIMLSLPVQMLIYQNIIFCLHSHKSNDHPAVSVYCTNMGAAKHHKFLILINVDLLTKVV